jgi:predicted glycoside hydrolase/deacetylase ChbG (UPF0249 family)
MKPVNRIIVNADDLGYSTAVNEAILRSFLSDLISSTSLLANMPGFVDAAQLVRQNSRLKGKVGVHLNLTEGYALSGPIRQCPRFCDPSGAFIYRREKPLFFLSRPEQKAVYAEMKAQIDRVISEGIQPSHLDSHHHVHTEWAIGRIAARLGKDYGIRKLRLSRNMGNLQSRAKRLYKTIFNQWYLKGIAGIRGTDYFGDLEDFQSLLASRTLRGKSIEVMVHPLLNESGALVDYDRKSLPAKVNDLIDHRHTISYSDL